MFSYLASSPVSVSQRRLLSGEPIAWLRLVELSILCNARYKNIFWVQGGLEAAEEEDLQREGSQPFKFARIFLGRKVKCT
ncbi:hypothetical protein SOVF_053620 isoform A [Spinacia oleracea]|nr:hypothetical protein SOVF_053620 isoform A [Spinacia oleracea]